MLCALRVLPGRRHDVAVGTTGEAPQSDASFFMIQQSAPFTDDQLRAFGHPHETRSDDSREVRPREFPGFERAFSSVITDLTETWRPRGEQSLRLNVRTGLDGGPEIYVSLANGAWHDYPTRAADYPGRGPTTDPEVAVADMAQETITEVLAIVWPVCQVHNLGLHPTTIRDGVLTDLEDLFSEEEPPAGPGAWRCNGDGGHAVARIGELTTGLAR